MKLLLYTNYRIAGIICGVWILVKASTTVLQYFFVVNLLYNSDSWFRSQTSNI